MLMKAPALFGEFSAQGVRQWGTGCMVNLADYEKLVNDSVGAGKDTVRFQKLLVRFVDDATKEERAELVNGLRTFILNFRTGLTDLTTLLETVAVGEWSCLINESVSVWFGWSFCLAAGRCFCFLLSVM